MRWSLLAALLAAFAAGGSLVMSPGAFITETTPVPPVGALGGPSRALSPGETSLWIAGRLLFDKDFGSREGLGGGANGDFNGDSCRACHQDPVIGGAASVDLNVSRFASNNGGAGPFANLPGGQIVSRLRRPDTSGREEIPAAADLFEQRNAPSILGLGLLESVPASHVLSLQDPGDINGDGVFGVARMVDTGGGAMELGRFGWKAQVPTLEDFARDAMAEELGITVPDNLRGFGSTSDTDGVPDPELSYQQLDAITFFMRHLAPPPRKGSTNPLVGLGETLFSTIGCAACHVPSLPGADGPVNAYTNLLLHNVQAPGFEGMEEPGAPAGFYRTPPLWGISDTAPYWHDGRAEDLNQAILLHQGEAAGARANYQTLSSGERQALILFLEDL